MPDARTRIAAEPSLPAVAAACRTDVLAELADRVRIWPGGAYIGDQWLDEALAYVSVSVEHAGLDTRLVLGAYAPSAAPTDGRSDNVVATDLQNFIVAVPDLLAHHLEWDADEAVHLAHALATGDGLRAISLADGATAGRIAAAATRLWHTGVLDDRTFDELGPLVDAVVALHARLPDRFDQALEVAEALEGDLLADTVDDATLADTLEALVTPSG